VAVYIVNGSREGGRDQGWYVGKDLEAVSQMPIDLFLYIKLFNVSSFSVLPFGLVANFNSDVIAFHPFSVTFY
jgi:hypothetical protein